MAAPIDRLIATLTETRAKLEDELGRVEAYRALRQLEQREATGERLNIVPADQLRQKLEAELAGNHYLNARRKLDEALELLGSWGKAEVPTADATPAKASIESQAETAPIPQTGPAVAEPAIPANMFPMATATPAMPPDDLSLIRDLPSVCVSVVTAAGFGRYKALAEIDASGVAMLERLLGQPGIVSRGNWVEQAAILAAGRETRHAARLIARRTGAEWPPAPVEPELLAPLEVPVAPEIAAAETPVATGPEIEAVTPPAAPRDPDEPAPVLAFDLTSIRGIDSELAAQLSAAGVTAFSDVARWTAADLDRLSQHIGISPGRISSEGWIEQAAMLATGRATRFLDRWSVLPPLARMPFEIVIAAESDPPAAPIMEIAAAAPEATPATDSEPIFIDVPANDPLPLAESPEATPFWTAATGKPAVLRPVRKPAGRTDKAFDDVAALVARTVATARNVGGMRERPKRPQRAAPGPTVEPAYTEVPFRPATPPARQSTTSAEVTIRAAVPPVATQVPPPAPTPAPPPARAPAPPPAASTEAPRRRMSVDRVTTSGGFDPEASIEIRPRAAATPEAVSAKSREVVARHQGTTGASTTKGRTTNGDATLGPLAKTLITPRAPGKPRAPLSAQRNPPNGRANGNGRQTIVIDELSGRRPNSLGISTPQSLEADLPVASIGGLVGRFVKALRGDKAG